MTDHHCTARTRSPVGRTHGLGCETPPMDQRQLARILNGGRVVIGAASVVAPGFVGSRWYADDTTGKGTFVATRAFGARDLALGLGTIGALDAGEAADRWLRMGVVCDAVDAAATLLAIRHIGVKRALPVLMVAVGATIAGATFAGGVGD